MQSAEFVDGKPVKLRIPDKIAAVRELVRMCGWAKPDRVEISGTDTLTDFIPEHPPGGQDPGAREGQRGSELKLWQRKIFVWSVGGWGARV